MIVYAALRTYIAERDGKLLSHSVIHMAKRTAARFTGDVKLTESLTVESGQTLDILGAGHPRTGDSYAGTVSVNRQQSVSK